MTVSLLAMSKKDIDRHDVLQRLIRKEIRRSHAAKLLHLTVRHVTRLKQAVVADGVLPGSGESSEWMFHPAPCLRAGRC